jgi:hypothetical protein
VEEPGEALHVAALFGRRHLGQVAARPQHLDGARGGLGHLAAQQRLLDHLDVLDVPRVVGIEAVEQVAHERRRHLIDRAGVAVNEVVFVSLRLVDVNNVVAGLHL